MLLKVGSKGEDVKKLQEKLGLTADGSFGPGTEKAVKEWQSKNGLTADGIVGEGTWSKMMDAAPVAAAATPAPSGGPMDISKLKGHVPDAVITQLPEVMEKFQINTPLRIAHFLSQCGHESGNFKVVNENLNYGAKGLLGLFKKYFPVTIKRFWNTNGSQKRLPTSSTVVVWATVQKPQVKVTSIVVVATFN